MAKQKRNGAGRPPMKIPAGVRRRLGKEPDTKLAKEFGVGRDTVASWRARLDKPTIWRGGLRGKEREAVRDDLSKLNKSTSMTMTAAAEKLGIAFGIAKQLSSEAKLVWQGRKRTGRDGWDLKARAVYAMVDLGGMHQAEAAEVMGIVPQAIGRHLKTGRRLAKESRAIS